MNNFLTEVGNNIFVVSSIMGVCCLISWVRRKKLAPKTIKVVTAWAMIFLSIGIHRAYWSIGLKFKPPDQPYHWVALAYKDVMTLLVAAMFLGGMILFIKTTHPTKTPPAYLAVITVITISIVFALLHP